MKVCIFLVFAALLPVPIEGAQLRLKTEGDKTITKIVKMLQDMLDKSKTASDDDRKLFAKFKCYYDTNKAEKTKSVEDLTQKIGLLENKISALQSDTGALSVEVAELQAKMDEIEQARDTAEALRVSENSDFKKEEQDLITASGQLEDAIEVLAAIGGDQTLTENAEHEKYMAGFGKDTSLVKLKVNVKQALIAAGSFLKPSERAKADAFLQQKGIGGVYSSQSGEIVGILKEMKETFDENLDSARAAEKAANKTHHKFIQTKKAEYKIAKEAYDDKDGFMGDNDGELSGKRKVLQGAIDQKKDDEEFLEKLEPIYEKKAEEYEKRRLEAANEEAAISKAIAILNSDKAFSTFGKVKATSTGATELQLGKKGAAAVALIQLRQQKAVEQATKKLRMQVVRLLTQVKPRSDKLRKVAALITTGNPFTKVLDEIENMKKLIEEEADLDKEQLDWCNDERTEMNKNLKTKKNEITGLKSTIGGLETDIDDPQTGYKVMISDTEKDLEDNQEDQAEETKQRRGENQLYQKNVRNMAEAAVLLERAIGALKEYYERDPTFVQQKRHRASPTDPDPPDADFSDDQDTKGNKVIKMLEFVLKETEAEEEEEHKTEADAQHDYEDSMQTLIDDEKDYQKDLKKYRKELADAEKELEEKRVLLEETEKEKLSIEHYLDKIKPGCDFITDNYDDREQYRTDETAALDKAVTLLKDSAGYKQAAAAEKEENWGKCKDTCKADEKDVSCKACLADVSIPGYCAGHKSTPGCDGSL